MRHLADNLEALREIEEMPSYQRRQEEQDRLRKEIKAMIDCLTKPLPWMGRVLTIGKYYGGVIKKLRIKHDDTLEFIIENGVQYHLEVPLKDLLDVQEFKTLKGKYLSIQCNHE